MEPIVGSTLRVQVTFRDWEQEGSFGDPVDPNTVEVDVIDLDTMESTVEVEQAVRSDVGVYYYDWTPQQVGGFRVRFVGNFTDAAPAEVYEDFTVIDSDATSATPITGQLAQDYEILFATSAQPLLIDPEEFVGFYDDANLVEIMGLIHRYSVEVQRMFGGAEPPLAAYEYVRAAVLCSLSRTYGGGLDGDESAITLGDFQVSTRGAAGSGRITRSNATTWCELAAVTRQEMRNANARSKTYVRGSKFANPMPQRHIRAWPRKEREYRGH